jgi:hypothetical protein
MHQSNRDRKGTFSKCARSLLYSHLTCTVIILVADHASVSELETHRERALIAAGSSTSSANRHPHLYPSQRLTGRELAHDHRPIYAAWDGGTSPTSTSWQALACPRLSRPVVIPIAPQIMGHLKGRLPLFYTFLGVLSHASTNDYHCCSVAVFPWPASALSWGLGMQRPPFPAA